MSKVIIYFFITAFLGWVYETLFEFVKDGKYSNRGFLFGPICPIYGFVCLIALFLQYLIDECGFTSNKWLVFILIIISVTILEYLTSYILEKLFHARWWDYSNLPFNLNGRISLFSSLFFGLAGIFLFYILKPIVYDNLLGFIDPRLTELLSYIFIAMTGFDTALTVSSISNFNAQFNSYYDNIINNVSNRFDNLAEKTNIQDGVVKDKFNYLNEEYIQKFSKSISGFNRLTIKRIRKFSNSEKTTILDRIKNLKKQDS